MKRGGAADAGGSRPRRDPPRAVFRRLAAATYGNAKMLISVTLFQGDVAPVLSVAWWPT